MMTVPVGFHKHFAVGELHYFPCRAAWKPGARGRRLNEMSINLG